MTKHYFVKLPNDQWVNLYVSDTDACLEDGQKREVCDTWWPTSNEPLSNTEWTVRYNEFFNEVLQTKEVTLKEMSELVSKHIGNNNPYYD